MSTCANRRHCISITTSGKKKKCFTSRKRVWGILVHARTATECLSQRHELASVPKSGSITQAESVNCKNACQMAVSMVRKF